MMLKVAELFWHAALRLIFPFQTPAQGVGRGGGVGGKRRVAEIRRRERRMRRGRGERAEKRWDGGKG